MTALLGIDVRLRLARLYLITDGRTDTGDFTDFVDAGFRGGVDLLEVRDSSLTSEQALAVLTSARSVALRYQGLVAVYNSADLAAEFSSDVLHLGQSADATPKQARRGLSTWAVIGRSAHTPEQVDAALADPDVAFLLVGPVFVMHQTGSAPQDGLELVRYAAKAAPPGAASSKPWFAVGGITESTIDEVLAAGARRVAVARAITSATAPEESARHLCDKVRSAWDDDPAMDRIALGPIRQHQF